MYKSSHNWIISIFRTKTSGEEKTVLHLLFVIVLILTVSCKSAEPEEIQSTILAVTNDMVIEDTCATHRGQAARFTRSATTSGHALTNSAQKKFALLFGGMQKDFKTIEFTKSKSAGNIDLGFFP